MGDRTARDRSLATEADRAAKVQALVAEVAAVRSEGGDSLVDLTITTTNQNGEAVLTGTATARLDP